MFLTCSSLSPAFWLGTVGIIFVLLVCLYPTSFFGNKLIAAKNTGMFPPAFGKTFHFAKELEDEPSMTKELHKYKHKSKSRDVVDSKDWGDDEDGYAESTVDHIPSKFKVKFDPNSTHLTFQYVLDDEKSKVVTSDIAKLYEKLEHFEDPSKIQVITDFDYTMTRFSMATPSGSTRVSSSHGVLEKSGLFGEKFAKAALSNYEKYYPMEVSSVLSFEEKKKAMEEWWGSTHALIQEVKVKREDIKTCVKGANFVFRDDMAEALWAMNAKEIPVMIFSAGSLQHPALAH